MIVGRIYDFETVEALLPPVLVVLPTTCAISIGRRFGDFLNDVSTFYVDPQADSTSEARACSFELAQQAAGRRLSHIYDATPEAGRWALWD